MPKRKNPWDALAPLAEVGGSSDGTGRAPVTFKRDSLGRISANAQRQLNVALRRDAAAHEVVDAISAIEVKRGSLHIGMIGSGSGKLAVLGMA
eukprot:7981809-Alexandrium_andersonii.AAC.2